MSVKCPSCGFDSPDGAGWCDFCKEPFGKKPKPPEPPPPSQALSGLTKEKVEQLAVGDLLKAEVPPPSAVPPWLKAMTWLMFAVCIAGIFALFAAQRRLGSLAAPAAEPAGAPAPPNTPHLP